MSSILVAQWPTSALLSGREANPSGGQQGGSCCSLKLVTMNRKTKMGKQWCIMRCIENPWKSQTLMFPTFFRYASCGILWLKASAQLKNLRKDRESTVARVPRISQTGDDLTGPIIDTDWLGWNVVGDGGWRVEDELLEKAEVGVLQVPMKKKDVLNGLEHPLGYSEFLQTTWSVFWTSMEDRLSSRCLSFCGVPNCSAAYCWVFHLALQAATSVSGRGSEMAIVTPVLSRWPEVKYACTSDWGAWFWASSANPVIYIKHVCVYTCIYMYIYIYKLYKYILYRVIWGFP